MCLLFYTHLHTYLYKIIDTLQSVSGEYLTLLLPMYARCDIILLIAA